MLAGTGLYQHQTKGYGAQRSTEQQLSYTKDGITRSRVSPIAVGQTPPRDPNPKREEWRQEEDLEAQKKMARWALVAWIVSLAGVAVTGVGVWFVKQTLEATRAAVVEAAKASKAGMIASTAAQTAAEASVEGERARFFIVLLDHNLVWLYDLISNHDTFRDVVVSNGIRVEYRFRNYGKTPGIIKEVSTCFCLSRDPFDPVYGLSLDSFPENMVAASDTTGIRSEVIKPITFGQGWDLINNTCRLWFAGRVDYEDVFGKPHTHRFFFRTVFLGRKVIMQPYDYKHYNEST
jgi:hypothetical protein